MLILHSAKGGTIMITNALFDLFISLAYAYIITISHQGLAMDDCIFTLVKLTHSS